MPTPGSSGTTTDGPQKRPVKVIDFQGLKISIENEKGSWRAGTSPDGKRWKSYMFMDYGEIQRTKTDGDGEPLDAYVGPHKDSKKVFVVHQLDKKTGEWDEDKVMLGQLSAAVAKKAYLRQYDSPRFFGGIRELPMDAFQALLKVHKGKKLTDDKDYLKRAAERLKSWPKSTLEEGEDGFRSFASSNVAAAKYDRDKQHLDVKFHHGGLYRYYDVPPKVWTNMLRAHSKGRYLNKHVKQPGFEYEKLSAAGKVAYDWLTGRRSTNVVRPVPATPKIPESPAAPTVPSIPKPKTASYWPEQRSHVVGEVSAAKGRLQRAIDRLVKAHRTVSTPVASLGTLIQGVPVKRLFVHKKNASIQEKLALRKAVVKAKVLQKRKYQSRAPLDVLMRELADKFRRKSKVLLPEGTLMIRAMRRGPSWNIHIRAGDHSINGKVERKTGKLTVHEGVKKTAENFKEAAGFKLKQPTPIKLNVSHSATEIAGRKVKTIGPQRGLKLPSMAAGQQLKLPTTTQLVNQAAPKKPTLGGGR